VARIELNNITHTYGDALGNAVDNVNITWADGSANALLGPSGCGKTTTLSIISGLLTPSRGTVLFDSVDVTRCSPQQRHIAQVFQFPVVYDTISVFDNLAFPLRNRRMDRAEIRERVEEIAVLLELQDLLKRSAGRISQAEKQKVSLGRGIVRKDTAAILLDEPLTVIDPKEKYGLRRKLREVQRELKITMIYVTHDQHEALTFADHVTVMDRARVVQTGTPEELHTDPASPFIGFFIGSPGMNLIPCRYRDGRLDCGGFSLPVTEAMRVRLSGHDAPCQFGIRPEFVEPSATELSDGVAWRVRNIEHRGTHQVLALMRDGVEIKSRAPEGFASAVNQQVWTRFPSDKIRVFCDDRRVI
jgi:glycerol transport system ATP-binding protein